MITSALILTARAQTELKDAADQFTELDANQLIQIFLTIASWFLIVVGLIAVVMVLWSAFQFITAGGGNEEQLSKAKKTLIYSIVGVVVAILAFSIVTFVSSILS